MINIPALPRRYHKASVWALYAIGLAPAVWYFYLGMTGGLGFNPVKEFEHRLGIWALRFIIASLAITPLRDLTGINWVRYRRALGLIAFYYVLMHFAVYVSLDLQFNFSAVGADIARRPYITIGFAALLLLIPLAVTSNNWSIRRLSSRWNTLHKAIYVIVAAALLHYCMATKVIETEQMIYIALTAALLGWRLVRTRYNRWKRGRNGNLMPQKRP